VTSEDLSNQAKRPKLDTEIDDDDDDDDGLNQNENDEKLDMLKNQSEMIAKEIRDAKRRELLEERERKRREENIPEVVKEIREERKRYMNKKMLQPQKGKEREVAALELLQKFGSRTKSARVDLKTDEVVDDKTDEVVDEETTEITENETDEIEDDQGKL
jgi:ribosomal protein L20A (L18A)